MTLNASGPISLGGTTAGQSAEVELGGTGTAAITMNDSNLRTLAAVGGSGTQWSMNSLYGKSNGPPVMSFTARSTSTFTRGGVSYNGTKSVAVGYRPTSYLNATESSPDGITWTQSTSLGTPFGTTTPYCVAWNGTRFITIGDGPLCAYSTDGITWTNSSSFSTIYASAPTYSQNPRFVEWFSAAGKFICTGNSGVICTSADGITWAYNGQMSGISATYCYQIAYNGSSKYIAVGSQGTSSSSANGVTGWSGSVVTGFGSNDITGIAYSSTLGLWVAIGGSNSACMAATSPDGVTWTTRSSYNTAATAMVTSKGYAFSRRLRWHAGLGMFVACLTWGIITSADGINWVLEAGLLTLAGTGSPQMEDSAYTGTELIIANSGAQLSGNPCIYTSP